MQQRIVTHVWTLISATGGDHTELQAPILLHFLRRFQQVIVNAHQSGVKDHLPTVPRERYVCSLHKLSFLSTKKITTTVCLLAQVCTSDNTIARVVPSGVRYIHVYPSFH